MSFLLVLIELFSLDVTADTLLVNIYLKSAFLKKGGQFQVVGDVPANLF